VILKGWQRKVANPVEATIEINANNLALEIVMVVKKKAKKVVKKKYKKAAKEAELTAAQILVMIESLRNAREASYDKEETLMDQLREAQTREIITTGTFFYTPKGDIGNPEYWFPVDAVEDIAIDYEIEDIIKLQVKPIKLTKTETKRLADIRKDHHG
jgi:hypothetical protein